MSAPCSSRSDTWRFIRTMPDSSARISTDELIMSGHLTELTSTFRLSSPATMVFYTIIIRLRRIPWRADLAHIAIHPLQSCSLPAAFACAHQTSRRTCSCALTSALPCPYSGLETSFLANSANITCRIM